MGAAFTVAAQENNQGTQKHKPNPYRSDNPRMFRKH